VSSKRAAACSREGRGLHTGPQEPEQDNVIERPEGSRREPIDLAILDTNLNDQMMYPLVGDLLAWGAGHLPNRLRQSLSAREIPRRSAKFEPLRSRRLDQGNTTKRRIELMRPACGVPTPVMLPHPCGSAPT
jgi:hypothetical protein